jgi:hypothetical protein
VRRIARRRVVAIFLEMTIWSGLDLRPCCTAQPAAAGTILIMINASLAALRAWRMHYAPRLQFFSHNL